MLSWHKIQNYPFYPKNLFKNNFLVQTFHKSVFHCEYILHLWDMLFLCSVYLLCCSTMKIPSVFCPQHIYYLLKLKCWLCEGACGVQQCNTSAAVRFSRAQNKRLWKSLTKLGPWKMKHTSLLEELSSVWVFLNIVLWNTLKSLHQPEHIQSAWVRWGWSCCSLSLRRSVRCSQEQIQS